MRTSRSNKQLVALPPLENSSAVSPVNITEEELGVQFAVEIDRLTMTFSLSVNGRPYDELPEQDLDVPRSPLTINAGSQISINELDMKIVGCWDAPSFRQKCRAVSEPASRIHFDRLECSSNQTVNAVFREVADAFKVQNHDGLQSLKITDYYDQNTLEIWPC